MPAVNPTALRKAKIIYNFGLSEFSRVNVLEPSCTQIVYSLVLVHFDGAFGGNPSRAPENASGISPKFVCGLLVWIGVDTI